MIESFTKSFSSRQRQKILDFSKVLHSFLLRFTLPTHRIIQHKQTRNIVELLFVLRNARSKNMYCLNGDFFSVINRKSSKNVSIYTKAVPKD